MNQRSKFLIPFIVFIIICSSLWSAKLEEKHFTIEFDPPDQEFAQRIAERLPSIIAVTNKKVGFYPTGQLKIKIVHSRAKFRQLIESSTHLPEKSLALAIPSLSTIIALNPASMPTKTDYFKVLTHEYLHLLLNKISGGKHIPLWFNEGFVQYFAGQWSFKREVQFVMSALQGKTLNLNLYSYHYPEHNAQVQIFYMQSYFTFKKLITSYSQKKVQNFLDGLLEQNDFRTNFITYFGISVQDFLKRTRESIPSHIILSLFYSGFGIIWVIIPVILIIAYIRKKFVAKKIEEEWKMIEQQENESDHRYYEIMDEKD